ncbi:hypothetical protein [Streptomyces sp. NPDC091273]|uniref:hypothetical protein n=1 Tax=unclassified Streptomyces TaxID=2593676 RepID=UPI002885DDC1|nr:hypothetical protein [Streptomyces sp. DSM 41633]
MTSREQNLPPQRDSARFDHIHDMVDLFRLTKHLMRASNLAGSGSHGRDGR